MHFSELRQEWRTTIAPELRVWVEEHRLNDPWHVGSLLLRHSALPTVAGTFMIALIYYVINPTIPVSLSRLCYLGIWVSITMALWHLSHWLYRGTYHHWATATVTYCWWWMVCFFAAGTFQFWTGKTLTPQSIENMKDITWILFMFSTVAYLVSGALLMDLVRPRARHITIYAAQPVAMAKRVDPAS